MATKSRACPTLQALSLILCLMTGCVANSRTDQDTRYLDAVREFADNVLKYGRDTYGPKHTPLFVDGLNIHTHEPVKWTDPDGTKWILCNLASQQNLFRVLDGLAKITGNPKYRQAAMEAIEYAFDNLRHPNGLFYWGHTTAYDAGADDISYRSTIPGGGTHALKLDYPHYELMWEVNPKETKKSIEAFWSAHIIDWSNLDFDRYAFFEEALEKPWNHKYDQRSPTFFKSRKSDSAAGTWTGTSLIHAGTMLCKLSGEKQPLIWSKRLAKRFVDTRHPKTGISYESYTYRLRPLADDLKEHYNDPYTRPFPGEAFGIDIHYYYGENVTAYAWMSMLLMGEMLGEEGKEFRQWALEEFTAWGKASYRKKDNAFVPILTDGTSLEGYVWKKAPGTGSEGLVIKSLPADMSFFWGYSVAYRATGDEFMWEMVRDIALGNQLGDIGETPTHTPDLETDTTCSHVYGLLGFLELYEKTKKPAFLEMGRRIGDNILANQFHKGFFVLSTKHIFTRFDCLEPLVLLRLDAAMKNRTGSVPRVLPSVPLFIPPYRYKWQGVDRIMIYTLTESPEVPPESSELPLSLQEAATIGDVDLVRTLIEHGTDVDSVEDSFLKTALHLSAMRGHKDVVELLIASGADVNARDNQGQTPLQIAKDGGHTEIAELLRKHRAKE